MGGQVFVNGTFDILHLGHLKLLNFARHHGFRLHVGIDSDRRVKQLKGKSRPINSEHERLEMLKNLRSVDFVYIFDTDKELEDLIKDIEPDIMIIGSDWKGKPVIGSQHAKHLIYFDRLQEYSSTQKIQNIIDRR